MHKWDKIALHYIGYFQHPRYQTRAEQMYILTRTLAKDPRFAELDLRGELVQLSLYIEGGKGQVVINASDTPNSYTVSYRPGTTYLSEIQNTHGLKREAVPDVIIDYMRRLLRHVEVS